MAQKYSKVAQYSTREKFLSKLPNYSIAFWVFAGLLGKYVTRLGWEGPFRESYRIVSQVEDVYVAAALGPCVNTKYIYTVFVEFI